MKNAILWVLCGFVFLFGGLALRAFLFPVSTVAKSVDMAYEVTDRTLTGDNAIYNYEWFKQQEADIRKCLANEKIAEEEHNNYIATLPNDKSQWGSFEEQEEASLRNSTTAFKKLTNKAIEDYNARASMVNRSVFKDKLPSNITRAFYTGLELTK